MKGHGLHWTVSVCFARNFSYPKALFFHQEDAENEKYACTEHHFYFAVREHMNKVTNSEFPVYCRLPVLPVKFVSQSSRGSKSLLPFREVQDCACFTLQIS